MGSSPTSGRSADALTRQNHARARCSFPHPRHLVIANAHASYYLAPIELMPVIGRKLLRHGMPLAAPADLRRHTLLHSLARPDDWASWLASVGEKKIDGYDGLKFESSALAFEAAVQGMGVAIGSRVLITEALAEGTLIAPFALTCRLSSNYYLVRPAGRTASRALRIFRQYLLDELQRRGAV
ncbi:LysR substrate-binding domain-containing protein [Paraburkholderia nemoris]|uniref:LysR substrate-binding domain-containing protein n=1 Tax=Paraburkholderia TaxID=1822464 RepID=UPI0038BBA714